MANSIVENASPEERINALFRGFPIDATIGDRRELKYDVLEVLADAVTAERKMRAYNDLLTAVEQVSAWIMVDPMFKDLPAAKSYLDQLNRAKLKARGEGGDHG